MKVAATRTGGVQAGAGVEGQAVTDGVRFRERGTTEGRAARYTILRRGTSAASAAPLVGARSARQGSRRAGFGRCGATARQRAEAVRRKRDLEGIEHCVRDRHGVESRGLEAVKRPQESEASGRQGARRRPPAWDGNGLERR